MTLTYREEVLPKAGPPNEEVATLCEEHTRNWLKKVRRSGEKIRYYYVGEYGGQTWRPHYHAILFGYPQCWDPPPAYSKRDRECRCVPCQSMYKHWKFGFSDIRPFTRETAQYVAGYVTQRKNKKKTKWEKERLGHRAPEFSRMSRNPGIAADAMKVIADDYGNYHKGEVPEDLPYHLLEGQRKVQLGRYLMRKFREAYGFENVGAQPGWQEKQMAERLVREEKWLCGREAYEAFKEEGKHFEDFLREERVQKVLNLEGKHELFKKRGSL